MNMVKLLKIGYLKLISQQYEQQYLFFVYIKIACITKGIMFYICHPMILSACRQVVIFSLTEAKLQQSAFNSDLWFAEVVNGRRFFTFYTMTVAKAQQHI